MVASGAPQTFNTPLDETLLTPETPSGEKTCESPKSAARREGEAVKAFCVELRQLVQSHQESVDNCLESLLKGLQQGHLAGLSPLGHSGDAALRPRLSLLQQPGTGAPRSVNHVWSNVSSTSANTVESPGLPGLQGASGKYVAATEAVSKSGGGGASYIALPGAPTHTMSESVMSAQTSGQQEDNNRTPAGKEKKKKGQQGRATDNLFQKTKLKVLAEQTIWQRIAYSIAYEWFSGILIVANSAFLGWHSQKQALEARDRAHAGLDPGSASTSEFVVGMEVAFACLFTIELAIRWLADGGLGFLTSQDKGWNIFDISIVSLTWVEIFLRALALSESLPSISIFRILRVVRIVRVVRVIRVMRFFRELRMMISSILNSATSLVWVFLVLGLVFFIFGINFTDGAVAHLDTSAKFLDAQNEDLVNYFGTLDRSIMSLYQAMSGGNDWSVYYDSLADLPAQYRLSWILYITFAIFAVVNIVTGVFVESALAANNSDRENVISEELEFKKQYLQTLKKIFEELDHDNTGFISADEFEQSLKEERVVAYFRALKLDVSDAQTLFKLLDYDRSEEISIEEFLDGCYRLQGESRTLDVKMMQYEVKYLQESTDYIIDMLREQQEAVAAATRSMQVMMPAPSQEGK